ncbi:hypothetical protein EIH07_10165 [Chryseobacterium taklimakanense]|nr:hypothetical protein EIH07_10165 [Chryseobacterium taklimakanense]
MKYCTASSIKPLSAPGAAADKAASTLCFFKMLLTRYLKECREMPGGKQNEDRTDEDGFVFSL